MDISVVVPAYNEEDSIAELTAWIDRVCTTNNFSYEVIFVDDGSTDATWNKISQVSESNPNVKGFRFQRNYGKAAALHTGFHASKGEVVFSMDANLQDSPDEIPELYRMITQDGFDLVSGWKKKRYDPFVKRFTSKIYNGTARMFSGIKLHDFNCGLKAYRSEVVKSIEIYGEMHRYIPMLAQEAGFKKIGEKVVQHQARKYGVTKYGLSRFINGYLDLLTISFITRFGKSPMHFFGLIGSLMFVAGFIIALVLGLKKIHFVSNGLRAPLVTDNPYFYIALAVMIIGTLLFIAGFLGELINRNSYDRNNYIIKDKIE